MLYGPTERAQTELKLPECLAVADGRRRESLMKNNFQHVYLLLSTEKKPESGGRGFQKQHDTVRIHYFIT